MKLALAILLLLFASCSAARDPHGKPWSDSHVWKKITAVKDTAREVRERRREEAWKPFYHRSKAQP